MKKKDQWLPSIRDEEREVDVPVKLGEEGSSWGWNYPLFTLY